MPLNKTHTLADVESMVRILANEIAPDKIQPDTIKDLTNKNQFNLCEMLNGALAPDYEDTAVLSDAASSYAVSLISTGAGYAYATRTITTVALHALTSADIGKRIVFFDQTTDPAGKVAIAQIESITSTYAFVVTAANGVADITSPNCDYAVFSAHSAAYLDLSAIKIDKIIKVKDSTSGLVSPKPSYDFENLTIKGYVNSVFYNHSGEKLFLFKGSSVSAWGTLTLYYYRLPTPVSATTDYLDVKEKYFSILIDMIKLEVYEISGKSGMAPKQVQENVSNFIRQMNLEKEAVIKGRQKVAG